VNTLPTLAITALLSAAAFPVKAFDGVALAAGSGPDGDIASVSLAWDWGKKWFTQGEWQLGGYWEVTLSTIKGDGPRPENRLYGVGVTPAFRFEPKTIGAFTPFVEAGIGVHTFSGTRIHGGRKFGSAFEFGDHVGFGLRFGKGGQHDIAYRYRHFSNGGITKSNPGINFHEVRLKLAL
jgi:lipid A 3-O-deacylase